MPSSNCGPGHPLSTELGLARAHVSQECDGGTVPAPDLRGLAAVRSQEEELGARVAGERQPP